MGKNGRANFRRVLVSVKQKNKSIRPALMFLVSLVLVISLFVGTSFSWFTLKVSELEANNFQLDCGKGLRVNDTGTSQLSFTKNNQFLTPASSVDGRNLFFPTDGADFSSTTANMTFRSANAGDKNQNYIQIDFTLTAQQNHTALYINTIDDKTSIKVKGKSESNWSVPQAAALRSALWCSTEENGVPNTPIVFNPTASTLRTAAVEDVDRSTGAFISSGRQVAHAFSDYTFGGTPVATLARGVETKFSYIIWLEGTDPKCTDKISNKDIQINLAFTTSWDKTETIRFKDVTNNSKIKELIYREENPYTLTLHYSEVGTNTSMDFNMFKYNSGVSDANNTEWSCNIPGDMKKNISFVLRPKTSGTVYEFKYSDAGQSVSTLDRETNRLYQADFIDTEGTVCYGHWIAIGDSDGAGHDSGGGFEGDDF